MAFHNAVVHDKFAIVRYHTVKAGANFVYSEHFTDDCFNVEHHQSILGWTTQKRKQAWRCSCNFKVSVSASGET